MYRIPVGGVALYNADKDFIGFQLDHNIITVADMTAMTASQVSAYDDATHIGQYEGAKAAQTSMTDSLTQNKTGIIAGKIGQVAGKIGEVAGKIG